MTEANDLDRLVQVGYRIAETRLRSVNFDPPIPTPEQIVAELMRFDVRLTVADVIRVCRSLGHALAGVAAEPQETTRQFPVGKP